MNKLHISPAAARDMEEILAYIAETLGYPVAARATVGKILHRIRLLREHPQMGAPLSSIAEVDRDYRFLVSGSYLVFYRTQGADIFVDRVLYGRRDYLQILLGDAVEDDTSE